MTSSRAGEDLAIRTTERDISMYLATPNEGGPGIVVLQEFWGIVDQIRDVADRLASAGFVTAVPDLYDGESTDEREVATRLMNNLDVAAALRTVEDVSTWLHDHHGTPRVGIVGFCMGGGLALLAASHSDSPSAVVVYYGAVPWPGQLLEWDHTSPPVQLHYADRDTWATTDFGQSVSDAIADAGGHAELHIYRNTEHAFLDDTRPESHHPEASNSAWQKMLDFLQTNLGSQGRLQD